jgi:spermidine/putrescine transport system ATP-binding protein
MLEVRDIWKTYEGQPLLKGVSFQVAEGETICLLGRSGSGKSTLLRIIAGLETPEKGQVLWKGQDLAHTPVHRRNFGLMFQDYALFPHRDVTENVAFGLRMQNLPQPEIEKRVQEVLANVNMLPFAHRRVTDLSGGEQQRVALARALAPRPRLLMLDEPLGALDRTLREQLIGELRKVMHETGIPAVYVTHDQEEAFAFADRLVLLHDGQVEQCGTPSEVYNHPISAWVARFFGQTNLLPGTVLSSRPLRVQTAAGMFQVVDDAAGAIPPVGTAVTVLLRSFTAHTAERPAEDNVLSGRVEDCIFRGEGWRIQLRVHTDILLSFDIDESFRIGQEISIKIPSEAVLLLDA